MYPRGFAILEPWNRMIEASSKSEDSPRRVQPKRLSRAAASPATNRDVTPQLSPANKNALPFAYPLLGFGRFALALPIYLVRPDGANWGNALVARHLGRPDLRLSPTRVLAHYLPTEPALRFTPRSHRRSLAFPVQAAWTRGDASE